MVGGTLPTVLVVEDEPLVRIAIADQLRDAGYGVIEAINAEEALELLRRGANASAVISDVRMPGSIDGIALARLVRSERPAVRVVLVSGHHPALDGVHHDGFFSKPYDVNRLIAHIRKLTQ